MFSFHALDLINHDKPKLSFSATNCTDGTTHRRQGVYCLNLPQRWEDLQAGDGRQFRASRPRLLDDATGKPLGPQRLEHLVHNILGLRASKQRQSEVEHLHPDIGSPCNAIDGATEGEPIALGLRQRLAIGAIDNEAADVTLDIQEGLAPTPAESTWVNKRVNAVEMLHHESENESGLPMGFRSNATREMPTSSA